MLIRSLWADMRVGKHNLSVLRLGIVHRTEVPWHGNCRHETLFLTRMPNHHGAEKGTLFDIECYLQTVTDASPSFTKTKRNNAIYPGVGVHKTPHPRQRGRRSLSQAQEHAFGLRVAEEFVAAQAEAILYQLSYLHIKLWKWRNATLQGKVNTDRYLSSLVRCQYMTI